MKFIILFLILAAEAATSNAFKLSLKRSLYPNLQRRSGHFNASVMAALSGADDSLNVNTVNDFIYMANVSVGNTDYIVQLDTGSSDLWIKGDTSPLPNTNQTSTNYNLTYGIGWAYGSLSYAAVKFAGITVGSQAFLDVSNASNPALGYGADGILGLGFTSLSTIDAKLNATGSSSGRSLLYNLFADNPSEPNFISFSLQRSTEPGDDVQGLFMIGEYDPAYSAVQNQDPIPTWPVNSPNRWTVLLDALLVGESTYTPTTTVSGAPSNKAVVLLDSGTSFTYAPDDLCNAIYGGIDGASFSSSTGEWTVPCSAEIDIALQFNGQVYPIHPLDVSMAGLTGDSSTCVGTFVAQSVAVGAGEFDWLIGDNVLRSVYSVYDFGDFDSNNVMGDPYIRLLSLVDPNKASAEFVALRGGTARTNITYNASNSSGSTSVSLSTDVAETLNKLSVYLPAMLGVLALNAIVLLVLLIAGIVYMCKRSKSRKRTRKMMGRMSPMPMNLRSSYIAGTPVDGHVYEPVSMAITDDTLFPPSPGFSKFEGGAGDRPKSLATLPSQYHIGPEEQLYNPSPTFLKNDRPKSVGQLPNNPEDQPFIAPHIPFHPQEETLVKTDAASIASKKSSQLTPSGIGQDPLVYPGGSASVASFHSAVEYGPNPTTMDITDGPMDANAMQENLTSSPSSAPAVSTLRPILKNQWSDRPRSAMLPQAMYPPPSAGNAPLIPPGSSLRPGFKLTDRPMSAVLPSEMPSTPPTSSPLRPLILPRSAERMSPSSPSREIPAAPPSPTVSVTTPQSAQPMHQQPQGEGSENVSLSPPIPVLRGSQLRLNAGERPMSVGILPSQSPGSPGSPRGGDSGFASPNPAFHRSGGGVRRSPGSPLRPAPQTPSGDRPLSMA